MIEEIGKNSKPKRPMVIGPRSPKRGRAPRRAPVQVSNPKQKGGTMRADYILTAGRGRRELTDYLAEEHEWVLKAVNDYWVALTDHLAEEHEWTLKAVNDYWAALT